MFISVGHLAFFGPQCYDKKDVEKEVGQVKPMDEYNDIYDKDRCLTGRIHQRGIPWQPGEFGLVVCVWIYDGNGHFLLTRRAKGKSFAGTWENTGGSAKAGETSRQAMVRELFEETGIRAEEAEFEFLSTTMEKNIFIDHYCLQRKIHLKDVVLQKEETDDVMWASFGKIHWMIRSGKMCRIIGRQFLRMEKDLRLRNLDKNKR